MPAAATLLRHTGKRRDDDVPTHRSSRPLSEGESMPGRHSDYRRVALKHLCCQAARRSLRDVRELLAAYLMTTLTWRSVSIAAKQSGKHPSALFGSPVWYPDELVDASCCRHQHEHLLRVKRGEHIEFQARHRMPFRKCEYGLKIPLL